MKVYSIVVPRSKLLPFCGEAAATRKKQWKVKGPSGFGIPACHGVADGMLEVRIDVWPLQHLLAIHHYNR
ncbi:hypothetical protein RP20_CCG015190 [Aedes albopictus]|nr:hypothetical protein RP20_CCG015190 [Aedes albopictus]